MWRTCPSCQETYYQFPSSIDVHICKPKPPRIPQVKKCPLCHETYYQFSDIVTPHICASRPEMPQLKTCPLCHETYYVNHYATVPHVCKPRPPIIPNQQFSKEVQDLITDQRRLQTSRRVSSYNQSDSWGCIPIIAVGIGLVLLIAFLGHNSPSESNNPDGPQNAQNELQTALIKTGTIQVNRPNALAANLRDAPQGRKIIALPNGTRVAVGELSSDRQWRQVTTQDGKYGWVWAEFVQF
jgi:hypothetical protein